jgi:hypothetical protein
MFPFVRRGDITRGSTVVNTKHKRNVLLKLNWTYTRSSTEVKIEHIQEGIL